jgi:hypothetical protein
MTAPAAPRPKRRGEVGIGRLPLLLAAVLAAVGLLTVAPTGAASPVVAPVYEPSSWTNGIVLCDFNGTMPVVAVSALSRAETGLAVEPATMTERSADGAAVASANLAGATWAATNESNASAYAVVYGANASVISASGPATPLGSVAVTVEFALALHAGTAASPVDSVAMNLLISSWPWQTTGDHLALTIPAWPAYADEEHLVFGGGGTSVVAGVSNSSGATFEQMSGAPSATADPGTAGAKSVPTTTTVAGGSSFAVLSVSFGSTAGSYSSLSYQGRLQVVLPATVAGIPTLDLLLVGGAAALVAVGVAVGTHRVRGRPSRLTYVEDEVP